MELMLTTQAIIEFLVLFVFSFFGSYTQDFLTILNKKNSKIRYCKVLVSALGMAILTWAASDIALTHVSSKVYMGINFLLGLMSYSIITQINSFEGLFKLLKTIKAFWDFSSSMKERDKKEK